MRQDLRDREHLIRLAALFAVGIAVFLGVRAMMVPEGFGRYGHFRPGALDDVRARPVHFAGRARCADCHGEIATAQAASAHAHVGCEACHWAAAAHADDPTSGKPEKLEVPALCLRCHSVNPAKPRTFPQLDPKNHYEGVCTDCHNPHAPK